MIQAQNRLQEKDFTVATPEEFVHRFGGTRVINKVSLENRRLEDTCFPCFTPRAIRNHQDHRNRLYGI